MVLAFAGFDRPGRAWWRAAQAAVLGAAALLTGCASLSPAECATANWRQIGIQDGSQGRTDRAAAHHDACAKAGIAVDVASYRAGRGEGLQGYCRLDVAINEGLAGRSYRGVCPPDVDPHFRVFHEAGYREHEARNTLARLQQEQERLSRELNDAKTPEDRKRKLRDELASSDRRIGNARFAVRDTSQQLDRLRQDLRQGRVN
ncbi:MAG: DUF2799 domain-containing protein [Haliea sp.]|nr:MAG: DUF2799 domain-containing protein [Haliea sp.]